MRGLNRHCVCNLIKAKNQNLDDLVPSAVSVGFSPITTLSIGTVVLGGLVVSISAFSVVSGLKRLLFDVQSNVYCCILMARQKVNRIMEVL